jgi:hypothetical protein
MKHPQKSNPYLEQRLRERERLANSLSLEQKYPQLKSLSVVLGYFDQHRMTHAGELRFRANVKHAKSILAFSCPNANCLGGGFDLSDVLLEAVSARRAIAQGELRCHGMRSLASKQTTACQHLLHYKLNLSYVAAKARK